MRRRFIRRIDAREALDLAGSGARIQTLRVTPLALLHRGVDEHLEERQVRLLVRVAQVIAVRGQGEDQRHHRDRPRVGHQARHLADATDVLRALGRRESEVLGEPVPDVVAVEQIRRLAALHQAALESHRDRRLPGRRQAGQQDGPAALVDREPAIVAIERGWVPGDIAANRSSDLDLASRADHACRHGLVASFVDQDERARLSIAHVRVGQHRCAGAQLDLTDVVERERDRLELALERLRIGPLDDLLHGRADDAGRVLERKAPAHVKRVLAHPADCALELPSARRLVIQPHEHVPAGNVELIGQRERHRQRRDALSGLVAEGVDLAHLCGYACGKDHHVVARPQRAGRHAPRVQPRSAVGRAAHPLHREARPPQVAVGLDVDVLEVLQQRRPGVEPRAMPSMHSFRHTAASRAVPAGESIDEVAFLLGHRDASVTPRCLRARAGGRAPPQDEAFTDDRGVRRSPEAIAW